MATKLWVRLMRKTKIAADAAVPCGPEGFQEALIGKGAIYTPESTVTDGRIITGRGAGHAVNFGLAILRYLKGDEAAEKVKGGLML